MSDFWTQLGLTTQGKKIAALSVGGLVLANGTYLLFKKEETSKIEISSDEKSIEKSFVSPPTPISEAAAPAPEERRPKSI